MHKHILEQFYHNWMDFIADVAALPEALRDGKAESGTPVMEREQVQEMADAA